MAEYIEREEIMNRLFTEYATDSKADIFELIRSIPATDVQPVRCGEWEILFPQNGKPKLKCTNCHSLFDIRTNDKHTCIYPKFCEECGADMRGDKNE